MSNRSEKLICPKKSPTGHQSSRRANVRNSKNLKAVGDAEMEMVEVEVEVHSEILRRPLAFIRAAIVLQQFNCLQRELLMSLLIRSTLVMGLLSTLMPSAFADASTIVVISDPLAFSTVPYGINNAGRIVGQIEPDGGGGWRGFLYCGAFTTIADHAEYFGDLGLPGLVMQATSLVTIFQRAEHHMGFWIKVGPLRQSTTHWEKIGPARSPTGVYCHEHQIGDDTP
jgi:hypothetical protein